MSLDDIIAHHELQNVIDEHGAGKILDVLEENGVSSNKTEHVLTDTEKSLIEDIQKIQDEQREREFAFEEQLGEPAVYTSEGKIQGEKEGMEFVVEELENRQIDPDLTVTIREHNKFESIIAEQDYGTQELIRAAQDDNLKALEKLKDRFGDGEKEVDVSDKELESLVKGLEGASKADDIADIPTKSNVHEKTSSGREEGIGGRG